MSFKCGHIGRLLAKAVLYTDEQVQTMLDVYEADNRLYSDLHMLELYETETILVYFLKLPTCTLIEITYRQPDVFQEYNTRYYVCND